MAKKIKDPSEAMRLRASRYEGVAEGTACTQSSFKTKSAFLFIGMQGGRHKAMFKLQRSLPEAARFAKKEPDRYQVGKTAWVTARFTEEKPMPKTLWTKWLDESYALSLGKAKGAAKKKVVKKADPKKTSAKKKVAKKGGAKKPAGKKTAPKTSRKSATKQTKVPKKR